MKSKRKTILVVFGTRPEAIKMCPLINELKRRGDFKVIVCVTGQHRQMLDQVLNVFEVKPDYDLSIMKPNQSLCDITSSILLGINNVIESVKPVLILVHGDTSTAFTAALAGFYAQIPIGHVEAGLRTYDLYSPFPEEFNRQAIGVLATYNFAPTDRARQNLLHEGKDATQVFVTGNTVIDALKTTVSSDYSSELLEWVGDNKLVLITAHRRENIGEPMKDMFNAIKRVLQIHQDVRAIYPVHMNPRVQSIADEVFGEDNRIRLVAPLDVIDFHNLMARSFLILTDSGGVQEEATSLGVPVLVMRNTTERVEGVDAGTIRLVGNSEEKIFNNFTELLESSKTHNKMSIATNPYGDGHASKKIVDIIDRYFM